MVNTPPQHHPAALSIWVTSWMWQWFLKSFLLLSCWMCFQERAEAIHEVVSIFIIQNYSSANLLLPSFEGKKFNLRMNDFLPIQCFLCPSDIKSSCFWQYWGYDIILKESILALSSSRLPGADALFVLLVFHAETENGGISLDEGRVTINSSCQAEKLSGSFRSVSLC